MVILQQAQHVHQPDSALVEAPSLRAVVKRTAVSLTVACVIPALLIYTTLVAFSISTAVVVALAWACGAICWRWITRRPPSALLLLTVMIMTVRTAFTLATGNTYIYFIQPVFADALVATIFLGSLLSARPAIERIAADFYPTAALVADRPRVRRLFRRLTIMWGIVILAKGSATFYLLQSQSMVDFVLIKGIAIITLTSLGAAATIWMSALVARQEHLIPQRERRGRGPRPPRQR